MNPYRLPRSVIPLHYDLRFDLDIEVGKFSGVGVFTVRAVEEVREVVLNAVELQIDGATFVHTNGTRMGAASRLEDATERCFLTPTQSLTPGEWTLHVHFRGTLNDKLHGFYRSSYKDEQGNTRWLAATQFEATDARRAFPCWDEPDFKATFSSTLTFTPGLTAISNTAILEEGQDAGKKVVRFAKTMSMSTYLLAYVVGNLEATEPTWIGKTPLRVWSIPGKKRLATFGQEIGTASLKFFEEYYRIPYPGDKLDLLAIPDFAAGAMENFGAITFRETALLVDERSATHSELERVADVVAHENAHMWFGDLVTMSWWNGLWLNEAFATFMGMLAVDRWKPEWQRMISFGISRASAMIVDGLHAGRPIEFPVEAPKDADAMFDVLTYEKGASVLRMLEQHIGPDVFRAGVKLYLDRHAYGNTETVHLWQALGETSGQPIPDILDGWVFQQGYPLLEVRVEGNRILLTQQPFRYLPDPAVRQQWKIPVQMRITANGKPQTHRLMLTEVEVSIPLPAGFESILVNEGGHGFFRVQYSPELLQRLVQRLQSLASIERFNLINDCWALFLADRFSAHDYLDLTAAFRTETDKNVWSVLIGSFHTLNRVIGEGARFLMESLVRDRLGPALNVLGTSPRPGESDLTRQLRGDLFRTLGMLGNDRDVQTRAAELYNTYMKNPDAVDANMVAPSIAILAYSGDAHRYDEFLRHFRSATTPQNEQRYLYALGAFRQPALLEQTLGRTVNGEIRTQDAGLLLRSLLLGVDSRAATWKFLQTNRETLHRILPTTGLRRMYEGVTGLISPQWEAEVQSHFRDHRIDLGGKTVAQFLEQLHIGVTLWNRLGCKLEVVKV